MTHSNINKPKKLLKKFVLSLPITLLAIFTVFNNSASYGTYINYQKSQYLGLKCGASKILSLFKFTIFNCTKNDTSRLAISNTYRQQRTLTLSGNLFIKNNIIYYAPRSAGFTIINFAPAQNLSLLLDNSNSRGYYSSYYILTLHPSIEDLRLQQSLSLKCQSPSQKKAGLLIVPSCNSQRPNFIIENTSNVTQVIGYYGTGNNSKFKNLFTIEANRQRTLDFSIISKGKKPTSMTYKVMVYTKSE